MLKLKLPTKIMTVIPKVNIILFNLYPMCKIAMKLRKKNVNHKFVIRFFILALLHKWNGGDGRIYFRRWYS
jgi:hypothetical protein